MFLRLRHIIARFLGNLLSSVRLNVLEKREGIGGTYYLKKRRLYAAPLIISSNLYLRISRTHIHFLSRRKWLIWEHQVYKEILGKEPQISDHRTLLLPKLEGVTLSDFLRSKNESDVTRIEAVGWAIRAIETMHKFQIVWPDDQKRSFSHGDAKVDNIMCDLKSETCCIFDYETIHDPGMSSQWRHSDDLRAIIYSAADYIEPHLFDQLCRIAVRNYSDKAVLAQLKNYIEMLKTCPDVYHFTQGHLGFEKKANLDAILLRELQIALND
ncbi:MAG: protein kinase family protein [Planctomycetota bacterium]|jgi:hypothetical protein